MAELTTEEQGRLRDFLTAHLPPGAQPISGAAATAIAGQVASVAEDRPVGEQGRELGWVTDGLRTQLDEVVRQDDDDGDWHQWLPKELDDRLGAGWTSLSAAELVERVDAMVGLLALPVGLLEEAAEKTLDQIVELAVAAGLEDVLAEMDEDELEELWNDAVKDMG